MDRRGIRYALVLAVLAGALAGCGLFEPRPPRTGGTVVPPERCRVDSTPDSVVANIEAHYGRATDCYAAQVDTAFQFVPDTQDYLSQGTPNPFDGWNRDVEVGVSRTISSRADTLLVSFDSEYAARSSTTNPTRETRYYNYHLIVIGTSADTARYEGQAETTFIQRTTSWALEVFKDHRNGSAFPTWGILRANNRVGQ